MIAFARIPSCIRPRVLLSPDCHSLVVATSLLHLGGRLGGLAGLAGLAGWVAGWLGGWLARLAGIGRWFGSMPCPIGTLQLVRFGSKLAWFCAWLVLDCNGMYFCSLDI